MQPGQHDKHGIAAMLARRVGVDAEARQLATFSVLIWHELDVALSPMFGESGVMALYKKSVELAKERCPCLANVHESGQSPGKFACLGAVLFEQTAEDASAAIGWLLNTFHDLLTHLIGGSTMQRLLRSIWDRQPDIDG